MSRPFRTAHLFLLSIQVNDYYINRLMGGSVIHTRLLCNDEMPSIREVVCR